MKKRILTAISVFMLLAVCIVCFSCDCNNNNKDGKVTVSYETNGGNAIPSEELEKGSELTLPAATREGYRFDGWFDNSELSGKAVTTYTADSDKTFYAKWTKVYEVKFNSEGGNAVASLFLEEGANVYDAVKDIKSEKDGVSFGAWCYNGAELQKNFRMPASDITLNAKYKIAISVKLFTQKLENEEYENVFEDLILYAYEGETFSTDSILFPDILNGFTKVDNADEIKTVTVNADRSKNVLKVFFDRDTVTLTFDCNYPDGTQGENKTFTVRFGTEIEVPSDMSFAGYCLVGFSKDSSSKTAEYKSNYIESHLSNGDKEATADKVVPERNTTLYAVWSKGMIDMFGGTDTVFLFDAEGDTIYMERAGRLFKGTYKSTTKTFIFDITSKNILEGKIIKDGAFVYYDSERKTNSNKLFEVGQGIVENTMIYFDEYTGIIYSVTDENGKITESHGTYIINDEGYFVAEFPETYVQRTGDDREDEIVNGVMAGKTAVFVTGKSGETDAFQIRHEEEYELGTIYRAALVDGIPTHYISAYEITLTGFGIAELFDGEQVNALYYTYKNENGVIEAELMSQQGQAIGVIRIDTTGSDPTYYFYNESLDITATNENGESLKLDGLYSAEYTDKNGKVTKGYYLTGNSVFGSVIIDFYTGGKLTAKYVVHEDTTALETLEEIEEEETEGDTTEGDTTEDEGGDTEAEPTEAPKSYAFEVKPATYAEYFFKTNVGTFYAPLLVIDDTEAGKASFYGYTPSKEYLLIAKGTYEVDGGFVIFRPTDTYTPEGTIESFVKVDQRVITAPVSGDVYYTYDKANGYVVAEVDEWAENTVYYSKIDFAEIAEIKAVLDTESTQYTISYWYSYTKSNGVTEYFDETFTNEKGEKLTLIAGLGIFETNGLILRGQYSEKDGLSVISTKNGSNIYFEIDRENNTFVSYETSPFNAYYVEPDTSYSDNKYIAFDGKGGATYVVVTPAEDTEGEGDKPEDTVVKYVGSFTEIESENMFGKTVYRFVGKNDADEEISFNYIMRVMSSGSDISYFVCPLNEEVNGQYTSENGRLILDGYSYICEYTDADGTSMLCLYYIADDGVVYAYAETEDGYYDTYFFDINKEDRSFTVRGEEYDTYYVADNQLYNGYIIDLDGYGNAQIHTVKKEADGSFARDEDGYPIFVDVDLSGTYTYEDGVYTVRYTEEGEEKTIIGKLNYYTDGEDEFGVFIKIHDEAVNSYINKADWSVLILGNDTTAVRYDKLGAKQTGTYSLITSPENGSFGLLYYGNDDGTDACIYKYWENGEMEQLRYTERGYYTRELNSLVFSKYGFAIFNAGTRYYYYVNDDDDVIIYHQDAESAGKNEYGFVEENFGPFDAEKKYDGNGDGVNETYYANNSAQIIFKRGETADENGGYPFTLTTSEKSYYFENLVFTPGGAEEFTVNGTVILKTKDGEKEETVSNGCKVVRKVLENGDVELYFAVLMSSGGYMRYDIEIDYRGEDEEVNNNRYKIKGKQLDVEAVPSTFAFYSALYSIFGVKLENTQGMVKATALYDINDNIVSDTLTTVFGEDTVILDFDGNRLSLDNVPYLYKDGLFQATVEGDDGYTYKFVISISKSDYGPVYTIYAVTRVQSIDTGDGYCVQIERTIYSEAQSYRPGSIYDISLYTVSEGTMTLCENDNVYAIEDNGIIYITRETDDETKRITETVYYYIDLKEKDAGSVEDEENKIKVYEGATVVKTAVNTVYGNDDRYFVDFDAETNEPLLITYRRSSYIVGVFKLDEATGTYTVKANGGGIFKVTTTKTDGKIVSAMPSAIGIVTYVTEDRKSYADVSEADNKVVFMNVGGSAVFADSSEYDENSKTYTVKSGDKTYTVEIKTVDDKEVAVITVK